MATTPENISPHSPTLTNDFINAFLGLCFLRGEFRLHHRILTRYHAGLAEVVARCEDR
jgi:hypothetical protein